MVSLLKRFRDGLDPDIADTRNVSTPLIGSSLSWQDWLSDVAPHIKPELMSPEHLRLWEWIDGLSPGVRPPAFLGDWPRGYGKTTTARLAMARMCVTAKRRFGLYICATQVTANNHINSIRRRFEELGVSRLEDKYGYSLGWSGERLRTENGFTLLALGLDQSNIRGLNLDDLRPDLIVLDDIDDLYDSVEAIDKKYGIITRTIIPAGSADRAILFVQNEIHANSVMHRFVSGEADALRRRIVSKAVAVEGMEINLVPAETDGGSEQFRITAGKSTWPGKALSEWELDLNEYGESSFRRECQHELGAGGLFFDFKAKVSRDGQMVPWHICPMPQVQHWWEIPGSHDYGTNAAACSLIAAIDDWGVLTVIGEEYRPNRTSKQQALGLLLLAHELGVGDKPPAERSVKVDGGITYTDTDGQEEKVSTRLKMVAFDHANTFPPEGKGHQTALQRMVEYPVEVWWRYGLPCVPAVKDIIAGLRNLESWLARTVVYPVNHPTIPGERVPAFRIADGAAPMLQGYLEKALKHPKDARLAVAPAAYEHAGDAGRYLVHRPQASGPEPAAAPAALPAWMKQEYGIDEPSRAF